MKLLSKTMKLWERVVDRILRRELTFSEKDVSCLGKAQC